MKKSTKIITISLVALLTLSAITVGATTKCDFFCKGRHKDFKKENEEK